MIDDLLATLIMTDYFRKDMNRTSHRTVTCPKGARLFALGPLLFDPRRSLLGMNTTVTTFTFSFAKICSGLYLRHGTPSYL
jgi:hypothetical protein